MASTLTVSAYELSLAVKLPGGIVAYDGEVTTETDGRIVRRWTFYKTGSESRIGPDGMPIVTASGRESKSRVLDVAATAVETRYPRSGRVLWQVDGAPMMFHSLRESARWLASAFSKVLVTTGAPTNVRHTSPVIATAINRGMLDAGEVYATYERRAASDATRRTNSDARFQAAMQAARESLAAESAALADSDVATSIVPNGKAILVK